MSISYDPDKTPKLSQEMIEEAEKSRLHIVHVICDEPGATVGDIAGVSFAALVPFIPRVGESITLQDGSVCKVDEILWSVVTIRGLPALVPNVSAVLTHRKPT